MGVSVHVSSRGGSPGNDSWWWWVEEDSVFLFQIALSARVMKTAACRIHDQRRVADL